MCYFRTALTLLRAFVETKLSIFICLCKFFANFFRLIFNLSFEVVLLKQRYKPFCNCATLFKTFFAFPRLRSLDKVTKNF